MLANASMPLVGMVDTAVVGHLPDPAYIGAVAIGAVVFHFLQWMFAFLRMGTTGFVAQSLGANDAAEINATTLRATLIVGIFGTLILLLKGPLVALSLGVVDASDAVTTAADEYLSIRLWSAPAALANLALLGLLFGLQRMRDALWVQLVLNLTNMVLDLYFVLVLDWGVAGVAWATCIAEYAAVAYGLWVARRALKELGGRWRNLGVLNRERLRGLLVVNFNIFIRTLAVQITFFSFTTFGARQGDVTLAANAVLLHLFTLVSSALDGFAFAVEALAGNAFGAKKPRVLRAITLSGALFSGLAGVSFVLAYALFGMDIAGLMTNVPEVLSEAEHFMLWVIVSPMVSVWCFLLDGVYFGTTRTKEVRDSMLISMAIYFACVLLLTPSMGNHGLWLAVLIFMAARAAFLAAWYPKVEAAAAS